ncbi:MAG: hypothetical protein ABSF35_14925 [Polyangia bacterium]|jgi:hypothetical protein
MTSYPTLERLFDGNEDAYRRILNSDANGFWRVQAEQMLLRATSLGVGGLEKIAKNTGGDVQKFSALLAEIRFANLLAEKGANVDILRDEAFGLPPIYTPDLRVMLPCGIEALVEVTKRTHHYAPVTELLDAEIKRAGLPFCVEQVLGDRLSRSAPDGRGRRETDGLSGQVVQEAVAALRDATKKGCTEGAVHVLAVGAVLRSETHAGPQDHLPIPEDVPSRPNEEFLASFVFRTPELGEGYAGGGVTACHDLGTEHRGKFLSDIEHKAQKRKGLPKKYASTVFLLAIQNAEYDLSPVDVLTILTGARVWPSGTGAQRLHDHPEEHPEAVKAAGRSGWQELLDEWDYGSETQYRFSNYGAYLDGSNEWAHEISGVLIGHDADSVLQWLPNPFSRPEINDTRLLRIGFPLGKDGSAWAPI